MLFRKLSHGHHSFGLDCINGVLIWLCFSEVVAEKIVTSTV